MLNILLCSILLPFVISFLFCHLCIFKKGFYQPHSAQPQKATSPATSPVEPISPEELLFHECFLMVRHPQAFLTAFFLEPSVYLCCLAIPLPSSSGNSKTSTECYAHGNIIATWQEENIFHVVDVIPFENETMFTVKNIAFLQPNLLSSSGYWAS